MYASRKIWALSSLQRSTVQLQTAEGTPLLETDQIQHSQPSTLVLCSSSWPSWWSPLDSLQYVNVFLVLGSLLERFPLLESCSFPVWRRQHYKKRGWPISDFCSNCPQKILPWEFRNTQPLKIYQPCTAVARYSCRELIVHLLPASLQRAASAVDADAGRSHAAVMTLSWWVLSVFLVADTCVRMVLC